MQFLEHGTHTWEPFEPQTCPFGNPTPPLIRSTITVIESQLAFDLHGRSASYTCRNGGQNGKIGIMRTPYKGTSLAMDMSVWKSNTFIQ